MGSSSSIAHRHRPSCDGASGARNQAHLGKLKCDGSWPVLGVHAHVLGLLDDIDDGGAGLSRGLAIRDGDDQHRLLQAAALHAPGQDWLDDLRHHATG